MHKDLESISTGLLTITRELIMADGGIVVPLVGALQACVSVLLTMSYGVAAQRLRLIQESSINDMAGLGVKLFLPALIIINLGEQLQLGNALNYIPVLSTAPPNYLGNQ